MADRNMFLRWPDRAPEPVSVDVPLPFDVGSTFTHGGLTWQALGLMDAREAGFQRVLEDSAAYVCDPVGADVGNPL